MNSKLTLSIAEQVIAKAKEYAKEQGRSLSNIVEEYLKLISSKKKYKTADDFHPLVNELCGSVKISKNKSYDEILEEAILEKYTKR